jgi:hypothetical protein
MPLSEMTSGILEAVYIDVVTPHYSSLL